MTVKGASFSLILLTVIASGCAEPTAPEALYLTRLQAVLDVSSPAAEEVSAVKISGVQLPSRRVREVPIPALQIDVLEFAQLHRCDLGALVGKRNSTLGRLQSHSQRLLYELEWLRVAAACEDPPMWLEDIVQAKRQALSVAWWNAVVASQEFDQAFSTASLNNQIEVDTQVLRTLLQMRQNQMPSNKLELTLGALNLAGFGYRQRAWQAQRAVLTQAARLLRARQKDVCRTGQPTPRMRRLQAVFSNYYLPLQATMASQSNQDRRWLADLAAWLALEAVSVPAEVLTWHEALQDEWQAVERAAKLHVESWQSLAEECGLSVGQLMLR